jgi:thiosulfate reductase/polysulfide reductase chain A
MAGTDTQSTFVHRFVEAYGSYNVISHESNCLISRNRAFLDTFGVMPIPDTLNCRYMVMAGANRFEALVTPDSMDIMTAMESGASWWCWTRASPRPRPWPMNGIPSSPARTWPSSWPWPMCLSAKRFTTNEFVAQRTHGFKRLAGHVKKLTPEWAEKECEIPAADIRRIARGLAKAAPAAMVYPGRRSSDYEDSTQIRRSMAIVNALLGNWDQKGGLTLPRKIKTGSIPLEAPFYETTPRTGWTRAGPA